LTNTVLHLRILISIQTRSLVLEDLVDSGGLVDSLDLVLRLTVVDNPLEISSNNCLDPLLEAEGRDPSSQFGVTTSRPLCPSVFSRHAKE